jgi:hypothetical protein
MQVPSEFGWEIGKKSVRRACLREEEEEEETGSRRSNLRSKSARLIFVCA